MGVHAEYTATMVQSLQAICPCNREIVGCFLIDDSPFLGISSRRRVCVSRKRKSSTCACRIRKAGKRRFRDISFLEAAALYLCFVVGGSSAEDSSQRSPENNSKGAVLTQYYCRRNYIQVDFMSVLCDTPGAYYYGSNAYRNSVVCMSGDKAHVEIKCEFGQ